MILPRYTKNTDGKISTNKWHKWGRLDDRYASRRLCSKFILQSLWCRKNQNRTFHPRWHIFHPTGFICLSTPPKLIYSFAHLLHKLLSFYCIKQCFNNENAAFTLKNKNRTYLLKIDDPFKPQHHNHDTLETLTFNTSNHTRMKLPQTQTLYAIQMPILRLRER